MKQNPEYHPEGDALYHSLQVFELARDALPYDEEFQLAALLHDVGKAIDPHDHVAAALEALEGHITERTGWLIEHHMEAGALRDGTLGIRARRRLESAENFDDLMLLCDCDRHGRQCGVEVPELEKALEQLKELARMNGPGWIAGRLGAFGCHCCPQQCFSFEQFSVPDQSDSRSHPLSHPAKSNE